MKSKDGLFEVSPSHYLPISSALRSKQTNIWFYYWGMKTQCWPKKNFKEAGLQKLLINRTHRQEHASFVLSMRSKVNSLANISNGHTKASSKINFVINDIMYTCQTILDHSVRWLFVWRAVWNGDLSHWRLRCWTIAQRYKWLGDKANITRIQINCHQLIGLMMFSCLFYTLSSNQIPPHSVLAHCLSPFLAPCITASGS